MQNMQIRSGQIIGRDHTARQGNCQDGYALVVTDDYAAAFICDGCSEGKHSEVGAKLGAQFLAEETTRLLNMGFCADGLPPLLYERMVMYLDKIAEVSHPRDRVGFIHSHLLFTIVGCIITPKNSIVFTAGDGMIAVDDTVRCIDQKNQPAYIAYHLIKEELPQEYQLADGFDVQPLPEAWQRVAIASDGFEPDLLPKAWNQTHPRGLQRKLIYWSNQEQRFRDDATIVMIERQPT